MLIPVAARARLDDDPHMNERVLQYLKAVGPDHRALFDRFQRLIAEEFPSVQVGFSYDMPKYTAGDCSINVGVWQHGISIYGGDGDSDFVARHPDLSSGRGTIRLPLGVAAELDDDELRGLARSALGTDSA